MTAKDAACVLAIDLGTSRVKVGVVNEKLEVLSSSAVGYSSLHGEPHMSEQRTEDWLGALALATSEVMSGGSSRHSVAALALTAQMPTLVSVSGSSVIGNAVTWQDSRADDLVYDLLTLEERRRVGEVAGTPIDGRYIVPMHCRRTLDGGYRPTKVLSAKDYLFFELTGEFATDPSTASGFGCYDLLAQDWSDELCALWGVTADLLPRVEKPTFARPLNGSGAALLTGVPEGTPVLIGAADSVCAHHFVTRAWPQALSVIDGSSTVIMASTEETLTHRGDLLCTPLIEPQHMGAELDLLATGSSISWLANLFSTSPRELEEMAVARRDASRGEVLVFPYLAGGEQG
ncbi:MAG: FGGY family carbohydrate kinase, partial [Acidimicrobiales bacterium]